MVIDTNDPGRLSEPKRAQVLSPVDRVSEMLFGLFMALTFVGAISISNSRDDEVRSLLHAALGCNLAWGLVDAVMYLLRTIIQRDHLLTLLHSVRTAPDAATGRRLIADELSHIMARLVSDTEIEAIRGRIVALPVLPPRPSLQGADLLAAAAIFLIVVASTFPVALPFIFIDDLGTALNVSRALALAMLFGGGLALGRYAGYGSLRLGFVMAGLGTALVAAIKALGG